ncbi:hypothetical protein D3C76_1014880 [compost metagenome]
MGETKLEMAVKATIMTMMLETMPASTAAVPITRPPTMDTVGPTARGIRTPASRRISKVISISIASTNTGNGRFSRCELMVNSSSVGISSM